MYPPPDAAAAMSELVRGVSRARARRTPVEQIHMTVLFLGDRPEAVLDRIASEARTLAAGTGPIRLTPKEVVSMPSHSPPRLIALETIASRNLQALYARLVQGLAEPDEPVRPTLLPHFTLCRFRRGAPAKPMRTAVTLPAFEVRELRLVKSTLSPEGASTRP
jgi:2'-5' RNA ligase